MLHLEAFILQDRPLPHLCGNFLGAHTQICLASPGPPDRDPPKLIPSCARPAASMLGLQVASSIGQAQEGHHLFHELPLAMVTGPPSVET